MNVLPQISNAEWYILKVLWEKDLCSIKQITAELQSEKHWNANMVRALIVRLMDKGVVAANTHHRPYYYYPTIPRITYVEHSLQSFLSRVYDGSASQLLVDLLTFQLCSLEEIKNIVEEYSHDRATKDDTDNLDSHLLYVRIVRPEN